MLLGVHAEVEDLSEPLVVGCGGCGSDQCVANMSLSI